MTRPPVRRIVTGHDDQGRAIILSDGAAPNHWSSEVIPGFGATVPWLTGSGPIDHVTDADPATADAVASRASASRCRCSVTSRRIDTSCRPSLRTASTPPLSRSPSRPNAGYPCVFFL